ncbi:hypothetical protein FPV67DRAFT_1673397 [Lyophyllum atratum]|nr:hypothetical protein FPV67DRAFT_1673397 [Lyophyllum atratum]
MSHYRYAPQPQQQPTSEKNPLRHYRPPTQPSNDPAILEPGVVHLLEYRIPSHGPAPTTGTGRCLVLPRRRTHMGEPSFPSIRFTVPGAPGPTLGSIVRGHMQLERPHDHVIAEHAHWSRMRCEIDWPEVPHTAVNIHTADPAGAPLTREQLAKEVAAILYRFFKANTHIGTSWADIRLLAVSYYRSTLVPILALDS